MQLRGRWFLLSLTLQIVAGALVVALAFGHGIPYSSALLPVALLLASVALVWPAWRAQADHRHAQNRALLAYLRQRAKAPDTPMPRLTDPVSRELLELIDAEPGSRALRAAAVDDSGRSLVGALNEEMRPSLNTMLSALGLLADSPLDGGQQQLLANARSSAQDLWGTVRDLFDYSELLAGRVSPVKVVFDPTLMVDKVIERWAPLARQQGIELASFIDPAVPARVEGDAERIEQILNLLLRRAVTHTHAGGAVISLRHGGGVDAIVFELSDSGDGLDDVARTQWAADLAGSDLVAGGQSDVGLPLARRLVDLLGGELGFDSRQGDGTRFQFELALPDAGAEPDAWQARRVRLEGARCLLVDDNRSSLAAIREQLHAWNVDVDTVEDGTRAVRVLQEAVRIEKPYDLAILDLNLPDLDGTELANRIRAIKDFSTLTLVSMVGDRDRGAPLDLHAKGFDAFLVKPVRQKSMAHWLVEALQRQRMSTELHGRREGNVAPEGARLLLVEDSPANRMVAQAMLAKAGYAVETAENGAEAVARARDEDWNLILMDLQMPVMDGLSATREIRRLSGRRGQVPVIAVTANVFPDDLRACGEAGMAEVVAKPIRREDLLAAVARWLRPDDGGGAAIDADALAALIGRLGEAGAGRVLKVFLDEAARRIGRIGEHLADPAMRQAEIDRLKQAAESFGISPLVKACTATPPQPDAAWVEELGRTLARVKALLRARFGAALG